MSQPPSSAGTDEVFDETETGPDPDTRPATGRADSLGPADRVIPSWTDPTVRRAADLIGGPLGVHAQVGRNTILTPLRVCILMALVVLIGGWLYKSACIQQMPGPDGAVVLDQDGQRPWITGCYNDVVPLYGSHHLDTLQLPYKASWEDNGEIRYMEYPVATGFWMYGVAHVSAGYAQLAETIGLPVPLDVAGYFTIGAILLGFLYLVAVACTARMSRRRPWDVAIMCLSPLLIVHAFTNWDLLAIALTASAMLAWSRTSLRDDGSPILTMAIWAGVLLGLGTAAKLYPALLLGPLLVLCLRTGRMTHWFATAGAAVLTWVAVNVPVMLAWPDGWFEFIRLNSQRPAEYDSWYFIVQELTGTTLFAAAEGEASPTFLNMLSLVLFLVACAAIGWFALSTARRPRFAQLAFLVVAAFLLTNKVWSPQYSIWLLPLVALALPRWRPVLAWQFSEWVVWILLMLSFSSDTGKNLSIHPFLVAAIVRDVLLIVLIVKVVREILRPATDLIRMAGDDDPTGGVLADAGDRWTLPSLPSLLRRRTVVEQDGAGEPTGTDDLITAGVSAGSVHGSGVHGAAAGEGSVDLSKPSDPASVLPTDPTSDVDPTSPDPAPLVDQARLVDPAPIVDPAPPTTAEPDAGPR